MPLSLRHNATFPQAHPNSRVSMPTPQKPRDTPGYHWRTTNKHAYCRLSSFYRMPTAFLDN